MSGPCHIPEVVPVRYEVVGSSEHSGEYVAENIIVDRPRDHSSRWSAANGSPNTKQWIRLRLKTLSVLKSITFGKFHKPHPCNMKDFVVLVGTNESNMTEVLRAGLKNDTTPETFSIRSTNRVGLPFPTGYVEIVPLSVHGQNFNTSIWHVSFSGITDETYVEQIQSKHQEYRENVALRRVLKHLRQRRLLTPVNQILQQSGVRLEHPLVTSIHESFVLHGDWSRTEQLIEDCANAGLLRNYRQACQVRTRWTRIRGLDADGDVPCRRGGHAMCMDSQHGIIYLFGGWDGQRNLDDFWAYDIAQDVWKLLSPATSREKNGPGPRACHKMVFDSKNGSIYLLGRLRDPDMTMDSDRTSTNVPLSDMPDGPALRNGPITWQGQEEYASHDTLIAQHLANAAARVSRRLAESPHCSEFYRYHTRGLDAGTWDLLAFDTAASGGPPLVSDHQMEIDSEAQIIYVSGGRVTGTEWDALKFSGMYSYDIRTSKWKMYNTSDAYASHPSIPPRFGHSMVLDTKSQTLFIFGGQREEKYLADMFAFHIPTSTVTELSPNFSSAGGPEPCFTQRAAIDCEAQEIYVFGGVTCTKPSATPVLEAKAPYYIYRYDHPDIPGRWTKILPSKEPGTAWPQPRYAHQIVFDTTTKTLYLHGGNSGLEGDDSADESTRPSTNTAAESRRTAGGNSVPTSVADTDSDSEMIRLDDFWRLETIRPGYEEITRRVHFEIRKQQFREMCEDMPPIKALTFLQTRVSAVVNHEDPEEARDFRTLLATHLLSAFPRAEPEAFAMIPPEAPLDAGTSIAHEDSPPPDSPPPDSPSPRKRSPSSPEADPEPAIRMEKDPLEESNAPSPERFRQRMEMFERLMAFFNEDAKQPDQNLVDMMSGDGVIV
ncbi:Muskelin N-terminus-domain-containing protein [Trametes meyenii]|nr:Muskelin N-terminus-domain-containing protein [Trametes meyenii]